MIKRNSSQPTHSNLVSDDGNAGVTLPNGKDATYNLGLSPLFLGRFGTVIQWTDEWIFVIATRGQCNNFFSDMAANSTRAYRLYADTTGTLPIATENRIFGYSLRCLVSTTNS